MKKALHILLIAILFTIIPSLSAQYGTQFDNRGFENWAGLEDEPHHWHSTKTASGTWSSFLPSDVISSDSHVRPGSTGTKSAKVTAKKVLSVTAQGNITNGRMKASSTSASSTSNANYTDRTANNGVHCTLLNGMIPDSITVWVCLYTQNASHQGKIYSALHGDCDFEYRANASISSSSDLAKAAYQSFSRTTSSTSSYVWQRLSVAYGTNAENSSCPAVGTCTDPKYVLVVVTSNKEAGVGTAGDYLLVDDMLLIYNPTLATNALTQHTYTVGQQITIPFTLTGTMSPDNLNKSKNEVIAELSDTNGNFGQYPIELGRVTTDVSGSITAIIPNNIPSGQHYRVRVRSTNYPMTANNNGSDITITGYSNLIVDVKPQGTGSIEIENAVNWGELSEGEFLDGTTINAHATPHEGHRFVSWTEGETLLSNEANYSFIQNGSRTITANFAALINYTINATANPTNGGTVTGDGIHVEETTATLTATPANNYEFVNWTENGNAVSTDATYSFTVNSNRNLVANFTPRQYHISTSVNESEWGSATMTGNGTYLYGDEVSVTARPNEGYVFVSWTIFNRDGEVVSTDTEYTFNVTQSAEYRANFAPDDTPTSFIITASAGENGSITPEGEIEVLYDAFITFNITADADFQIKDVLVDGVSVGNHIHSYTFENVTEPHTIHAEFEPYDGIKSHSTSFEFYPNPVENILSISGTSIEEIAIYNAIGIKVLYIKNNGSDIVKVNMGNLSSGLYTINMKGNNKNQTFNVVKK